MSVDDFDGFDSRPEAGRDRMPAPSAADTPLTAEEAVEKALLYTFQLSGKDYRKMQTAFSEVAFIRALEQDGFTVATLDATRDAVWTPKGTRLVLVSDGLFETLGVDRVDWGEPDEHGWYTPTLTKLSQPDATADIDVERLARALNASVGTDGWIHLTPPSPVEEWRENARIVAAEYARSTPDAPRPETTDHE